MTAVDVAVAVPGAAPFSYDVPAELAARITPGVRVRVPFGSGQRIGWVTGPAAAGSRPLKPLLDVVDAAPVLTAELLALTRWIASYYRCGWGEAIRSALPPGMDARLVRTVFVNAGAQSAAVSPADRRMAEYLRDRTTVAYDYLVRTFGRGAPAALERLAAAGLVGVYHVWQKARVSARQEQWLVARDGEFTNGRARAQRQLWQRLQQRRALPPAELKGARAAASKLVASGLAAWEARVVERLPGREGLETEAAVTELTTEQERVRAAVADDIQHRSFAVRLLLGVTASGKTELYLRAARETIAAGRRVLILVPEIGLTHQMVGRVRAALGEAAVLHSEMGGGERFDAWRLIREGRYRVVVGTRSAVFAPLDDIGLIVVDEEQDPSYKQQDSRPCYHARDVAIVRARAHGAAVLLGSATPSIETYHKAVSGKFALSELTVRVSGAAPPAIEIIDLRQQPTQGIIAAPLADALRDCVAAGGQAMLLLNRRGLAACVQCGSCGEVLRCPNCSVSLTPHRAPGKLLCHYCGYARQLDRQCPRCRHLLLLPRGWGTQQLEAEVATLLPGRPVLRMDADTTARKGSHLAILRSFESGHASVLIGTQMIAKGHHFPAVTVAGIVNIDDVLGFPDFRAGERAFQLLHQGAGPDQDPGASGADPRRPPRLPRLRRMGAVPTAGGRVPAIRPSRRRHRQRCQGRRSGGGRGGRGPRSGR
ncbi:MAG: primosomal protein N' [Candidatus Edwardsbacteria bacterium]|nr:primosomal protein N' [Candidatus Edwardsbacteria bacterium]